MTGFGPLTSGISEETALPNEPTTTALALHYWPFISPLSLHIIRVIVSLYFCIHYANSRRRSE